MDMIRSIYDASHQNYGAPKITAIMKEGGEKISEKTVGNYLKEMGIHAQYIKHYTQTTKDSNFSDDLKNILEYLEEIFICSHEDYLFWKDEIEKELGIEVDSSELEYLGFLLYDKPIRFMYYLKKDIDIKDIVVQEEEVDFVKYMSIDEIKEIISREEITKSHGILFNKMLELKNK